MAWERVPGEDVTTAVRGLTPYLVDKRYEASKNIYFDGWDNWAASPVLRALAQDPPPAIKSYFSKIVHIDCTMWKSRRALQRTIAVELNLPHWIMTIFDRQDEEDDFRGVDESSRLEIESVGVEVHRALQGHTLLVVFHNGIWDEINLHDFGIPQPSRWTPFVYKILWTFRGRFRLGPGGLSIRTVDHRLYCRSAMAKIYNLLQEETREVATYARKLAPGITITQKIADNCCLYLLKLHCIGNIFDYNWATHASNYWVCDGIVQGGGNPDQAWKDGAALHQVIWVDIYTSKREMGGVCDNIPTSTTSEQWMVASHEKMNVPTDESTSFFLENAFNIITINMFHRANKLRVLKLCKCAFNFSTPPFYCCHSLRFLGLDDCKDIIVKAQSGEGERQEEDIPTKNQAHEQQERETETMEFFQSLWVLDIHSTDWTIPENAVDKMGENIREVNVRKGRIWGSRNLSWRRLRHNLRKLRIIAPISTWETGQRDEFMGMAKLELLDLTGNQSIQVFPNLSGATGLKTLVLDGCVGLEQVGPQEHLPPSVESVGFDAGLDFNCKLAKISLQGCKHLEHFKLKGRFPCLEELDLSRTSIKKLDLSDVVCVPIRLKRLFLMGCKQLRAILWWKWIEQRPEVLVLRIDTNGVGDSSSSLLVPSINHQQYDGIVLTGDVRFIQCVYHREMWRRCVLLITNSLYLCLHKPVAAAGSSCRTAKGSGGSSKKKRKKKASTSTADHHRYCYNYYEQEAALTTVRTSTSSADDEVLLMMRIEGLGAAHDHDDYTMQPLGRHVEIGQGIRLTDVESPEGIKDVYRLLTKHTDSLHVHDNSSMTSSVYPKTPESGKDTKWELKRLRIERCSKLQAVFAPSGTKQFFKKLETILVAHLLSATCIWSKGMFFECEVIRSIHICFCPRLKFVLPLSEYTKMPRLEILQIVSCGDLRHIFPLDEGRRELKEKKDFPSLKRIYLHDLPSLEQVCEPTMRAPALETITMRGCWSLRRLPAVGQRGGGVKVDCDCERDVWERLEWDGLDAGHHPSLFRTRHPPCYINYNSPRGSILR